MDLKTRFRALEEATVLEVNGELDLHSAASLKAQCQSWSLEHPGRSLVIDLAGVSFIDSTGVGALIGALKRAQESAARLAFCHAQPRVRRVFEITGLIGAMPLVETRAQALRMLEETESSAPNANRDPSAPLAPEASDGMESPRNDAPQTASNGQRE